METGLLEWLPDGVVVIDDRGRIVYANRQIERLSGYQRGELSGRTIEKLVPTRLRTIHRAHRHAYHASTRPRPMGHADHVFLLRRKDGSELAVDIALAPIGNPRHGQIAVAIRDMSERAALEADLEHRALHDPLTDLANRTLFFDRLDQAMRGFRRDRRPVALVMMDVDDFKTLNDAFGHLAGDAILRQLAAQLQSGLRATDTIARIGGDEFAWILPHMAGPSAAVRKVRTLLRAFNHTYSWDGNEIEIGISAGMAQFPEDGQDVNALMRRADLALYMAKRQGGGLALVEEPARVRTASPRNRRRSR